MLQTNSLRIMIVSVACAAGLMAQDFPRPSIAASPDGAPIAAPADAGVPAGPGANIADQGIEQAGAPDPQNPQFGPPPPPPNGANNGAYGNVPATLTLPSGSFVTVRVNQWLSSDRNQVGDTFYATLVQPLIVDGVVVARKGSTVVGRVSEVRKSHVDGTSRLGLQLTSLSLVDGQQVTVQSAVVDRNGTTRPNGQSTGTVVGTTAVGAGIGAIAGGGIGAGIGAGIGLIAGSAGVLLTRGRPTEVYPESMVSFRLDAPVAISTTQSAAAFHYAGQEDYGMNPQGRMAGPPRPVGPMGAAYGAYPGAYPGYGYAAPYPYYPYPYYSPYYYGPGFGVVIGRGFYGGFRGGFRR